MLLTSTVFVKQKTPPTLSMLPVVISTPTGVITNTMSRRKLLSARVINNAEIFKHDQKDLKIKKMISKNKIENLRERSTDNSRNTHQKFRKPNLEIQVDSIVQNNNEFSDDKNQNQFKFKNSTPNTLEVESETKGLVCSEQKVRVKLSKHAQMIMDKLRIKNPGCAYEDNSINASKAREEEKGNLTREEYDQSRPMTTRIYDGEDDQQLVMQYPNPCSPKHEEVNRMSVEAGLERISKDKFENESENDIGQDQFSMIIKNSEGEESDYAFASQLASSGEEFSNQAYQSYDEDDDCMTVIEKE